MNKQFFIEAYKNSFVFKFADNAISEHFRNKLINEDFTILCSNCIGGIIYHRLGHKFLSPTINMWFTQPDFVKFLLYLDDYIVETLCFIKSNEGTPVATLGDGKILPLITLHFNHANSEDDAELCWNRRRTRINKDNLYIILYRLDGITIDELHLLDNYPCKNKVVFTSQPLPEIDWSFYIKPNFHSKFPYSYLGKNILGIRDYETKFDFISFLNK